MRPKLWIGTATLSVVLGALALEAQLARVERSWAAMVAATESARREVDALPTARPVLWGEAAAGNAEDDYREAENQVLTTPEVHEQQMAWMQARLGDDAEAEVEARDHFVDTMASALEAMRRGAHRTQYQDSTAWQAEPDVRHGKRVLTGRTLVYAATARAHRLADAGRHRAAARWLLDAAQFSRDRMHRRRLGDEVIGIAMLAIITRGALFDEGVSVELERDARALLADGLARLDQDLEAGLALRGEAVYAGLYAVHAPELASRHLAYEPLGAWREGFSSRLAMSKMVLANLDFTARLATLAGLPERRRTPLEARARRRFKASAGPLGEAGSSWHNARRCRREAVASLRLCRMLLALQLGEDPEPLADPFGGVLHAERRDDGFLWVWSDRPGEHPLALTAGPLEPAPTTAR